MNMWFLITIVFFFCVFIICCLVEIASILAQTRSVWKNTECTQTKGRSKTTPQEKQGGAKS